jgi:hypothetical protein
MRSIFCIAMGPMPVSLLAAIAAFIEITSPGPACGSCHPSVDRSIASARRQYFDLWALCDWLQSAVRFHWHAVFRPRGFGPFIGAAIFLLMEDVFSLWTPHWQLFAGVFFILAVLFLPQGVWGTLMAWCKGRTQ